MNDAKQVVLVVEDDAMSRGSLVRALQEAGFGTIEASDGESGLAAALESQPALIISDNLMPTLKGIEFLEKLRHDDWGSQVPFILLTAEYDLEAVNESLQAGNTDFLVKDNTSLTEIIETAGRHLAA